MYGYLLSRGVHVQLYCVRDSMRRVSPIECSIRWHQVLRRRQYCVPGPNSLWHIDGHHSLIRWRFVIHGGIDGYSRYITYLHCATNNRAATVFSLFQQATTECGVPSRVRSDKGGENTIVCHYMVTMRGTGRGSHLAGSSHHNQRIERLWRDVYRCVASTFYSIFYFMENQEILDPSNQLDLFVLHCVFLPIINEQLHAFVDAWNQHLLRTEHHWSPHRIWLNGVLDPNRAGQTGIRDIVDPVPTEGLHSFGIDYYGPLSTDYDDNTVEIPETAIPISEEQLQDFLDQIETLPNHNHGIDTFMEARELLGLIVES